MIAAQPIPTIAKNLAYETANRDLNVATRNARTMITSAENGGRLESYKRAKKMGIEMMKEWVATNDNRTRHSHAEINGEQVEVDEEFSIGLQYPGDESGDMDEVYNCRCTMVGALGGIDYDGDFNNSLASMSFEDWENER